MRKYITFLILTIAFSATYGQESLKPDFKNQPMLIKNGNLIKLEKKTGEIKVKVKGLGYGGAQQEISVGEGTSPVKTSAKPSFVIWVNDGVDPETIMVLSKTEFNKKRRNIPMLKVSAFAMYGARGKNMGEKYHVPYDIEKIMENVYKITPLEPLEDDMEYAFYNPEKTDSQQTIIFLFSTQQ